MNNPIYFELLEVFPQPGCPLCRVVQSAVERSLTHLFYESVTDPTVRHRLRRSLGFCKRHAWLLVDARIGDALGMAIIYHDLLGSLLKHLPQDPASSDQKNPARVWRRLPSSLKFLLQQALEALSPRHPCPACAQEERSRHAAVSVLASALNAPAFAEAFKASAGLCLPHLHQVLEEIKEPLALEILLTNSREKLSALHLELAEIIRKNDYRYRDEAFGPEGDAWKRAVALFVGSNHLLIPAASKQSAVGIIQTKGLSTEALLEERKRDHEKEK